MSEEETKINTKTKPLQLLTINEASSLLKVHPATLRRWDEKGVLKAVKISKRGDRRYRLEDIQRFIYEGLSK